MFIIEYFDRTRGLWRHMPADTRAGLTAEHVDRDTAEVALGRYRRRSPSCPMRVTATVPA